MFVIFDIINGDSNKKTIGDTLEFMFPQGYIYLNFTGFLSVCATVPSGSVPVDKPAHNLVADTSASDFFDDIFGI